MQRSWGARGCNERWIIWCGGIPTWDESRRFESMNCYWWMRPNWFGRNQSLPIGSHSMKSHERGSSMKERRGFLCDGTGINKLLRFPARDWRESLQSRFGSSSGFPNSKHLMNYEWYFDCRCDSLLRVSRCRCCCRYCCCCCCSFLALS